MKLTSEEFSILAHIVVAPQEWADHAEQSVGLSAVLNKIEKYRASWLEEKDLPDYKTRAERESI